VGIVAVTIADISKSGLLHALPNGEFAVIVSRDDPPERQRFTIAHEVGHRLLHPAYESHGMLDQLAARSDYGRIESVVNHFAACLLMPRSWIRAVAQREHFLERSVLIAETARRFDVSRAAAEIRLVELGHVERRPPR
jgi:Zn-dependent peptidase ImmA (M78 family)